MWPPERPRWVRRRLVRYANFWHLRQRVRAFCLRCSGFSRGPWREGRVFVQTGAQVPGTEIQAPKGRYEGRSRYQLRFDFSRIRHARIQAFRGEWYFRIGTGGMEPQHGERSIVVFRATRPSTGGMSYSKRVSAAGEPDLVGRARASSAHPAELGRRRPRPRRLSLGVLAIACEPG
jgi:hypothetical protein